MLTIKNIENTGVKEFSQNGEEWVLYGIDVSAIEYKFLFIPMVQGQYDPRNVQLVLLDRNKKRLGNKVLGYRLWTTNGKHDYVNTKDIPNWVALVNKVYENRMVCLQ